MSKYHGQNIQRSSASKFRFKCKIKNQIESIQCGEIQNHYFILISDSDSAMHCIKSIMMKPISKAWPFRFSPRIVVRASHMWKKPPSYLASGCSFIRRNFDWIHYVQCPSLNAECRSKITHSKEWKEKLPPNWRHTHKLAVRSQFEFTCVYYDETHIMYFSSRR